MKTWSNYPYDFVAALIEELKNTFKKLGFKTEPYELSLPYITLDSEAQQAITEAFEEMGWYFYRADNFLYRVRISAEQYKLLKEEKKLDEIKGDFE